MLQNGLLLEKAPRRGGEKQARGKRVRSAALLQPVSANPDTHTRTGLSAGLLLLEFQQVAIDLIVHIGVVFLLTQV